MEVLEAGHRGRGRETTPSLSSWMTQHEIKVKFNGFPRGVTTAEVWAVFEKEGQVIAIELFADGNSTSSDGNGYVRFR